MIQSLRLRLLNIPDPPRSEGPAKVKLAILFSGGLDCAVLARMAHDILPLEEQIDLLNVAFENPRVVLASKQPPKVKQQRKARQGRDQLDILGEAVAKENPLGDTPPVVCPPVGVDSPFEACPDRMTGRSALKELRQVCPGRKWNFVEVKHPESLYLTLLILYLGQYTIRRVLNSQK
jgi:asparagine synthetase B (glutamine-hydrolysing)